MAASGTRYLLHPDGNEFCRTTGRRFNYLGYWIRECPSMSYKANFAPHQLLEDYVELDKEPRWNFPPTGNSLPAAAPHSDD